MFDDISKERSQKAQKKNLASRRAYVRMVTNLGGSLNLELFCEKVRWLVSFGRILADV
jgi:peptidyl-prolyl cis-trans isomerase-like protein 2